MDDINQESDALWQHSPIDFEESAPQPSLDYGPHQHLETLAWTCAPELDVNGAGSHTPWMHYALLGRGGVGAASSPCSAQASPVSWSPIRSLLPGQLSR